ncbi:extracellular solute-binding protein [Paenibacillus sp. FSL R10-2734]|uniref:extracellular solute-binding protein n=1 Tax=Paenibacillus sp. FSL R10-2734 TaxID=2954691 RepID=UPI0030DA8903
MAGMKKRLVLLLSLVAVMLISACGAGESQKQASPSPSTSDSSSAPQEVVELTMLVNHPWWPFKEWKGKIPEEITKKTGVKLNIQVAVDDKQLPLLIASGELPDLVYTSSELTRLANSEISYPWNELISKYAPDFKIDESRTGVNTMPDGNFYTIKNSFSTEQEWNDTPKALPGGSGLAFRQDIMEELGNPKMDSLEDLHQILLSVKQKYPEMTPILFDKDQIGQFFRINFGLKRNSGFIDQGGNAVHYLKDPNYREYYLYMNQLYREKLMSSENFTFKDAQQDDQYGLNGQVFALGGMIADTINAQLKTLNKDFSFNMVSKVLSEKAGTPMGGSGWSGVYITKNNKNVEASIKFMQFMLSEEGQRLGVWGIEGEDWTWNDAENYPVMNYDMNDAEAQKQFGYVYWGLLGSSGVTEALQRFDPKTLQTQWGLALRDTLKFNPALGLVVTNPDTEEQVIETQIKNMIATEELKIYMAKSAEEASKEYDNVIAKMESMGLSKLEAWATAQYKEYQKNF